MRYAISCTVLILAPICAWLLALSGDWPGVLGAAALWFAPLLLLNWLALFMLGKGIDFISSRIRA